MRLAVRSAGVDATFRNGAWELGAVRGAAIFIGGEQVVGARQPAIPAPSGGSTADIEARAALVQMLSALRAHGLIES